MESWKTDGKCENCKRKNYCQKACTLNKQRGKKAMHNAVNKFLNEKLGLDQIYGAMKVD